MFLRELQAAAGLSVTRLHRRLPDTLRGAAKPRPSTLYRRLRGADLMNHRGLVEAVVDVCVTDRSEAKKAKEKAIGLLREAWKQTGRDAPERGEKCAEHLAKLVKLHEQLLEAKTELASALQEKAWLEAELDTRKNVGHNEGADLRRRLLEALEERDAAQRMFREERRRSAALEAILPSVNPPLGLDVTRKPQHEIYSSREELVKVREEFLSLDPQGRRITAILRQAVERLLDGMHTGRYKWEDLSKTEKATLGSVVENLIRHTFRLDRGAKFDFLVAGIEVDLKVTSSATWMIPREVLGALCLLVQLDHRRGAWSLGVVRATEDVLGEASSADRKRTLGRAGRSAIEWIHRDVPLPVNVLEKLPPDDMRMILAESSSQGRVNALFRAAQRQIVPRTAVTTIARQEDAPKRVRDARRALAAEGILILGHQGSDPGVATTLGLPVPDKGQWTSLRLTPAEEEYADRTVLISGTRWRAARMDDEPSPLPVSTSLF
ncbi:NaeI family type II restriction endonuclease [Streptomyces rimosus]|uniref:NaeI family type II restriction endonuclease n=1 Tax=Streptomyces rimosus TaxID=1927 RepID=UPI00131EBF9C|nr:NaeI family type II restriction endonuclease [Streptomyces rimosus]